MRRKLRRAKRPVIDSAKAYDDAWWNARYFGPGGKTLNREEFHAWAFADESELRRLYENNRGDFAKLVGPGRRHCLWWLFDSPAPRDEDMPEFLQLQAMGELRPDEAEQLRLRAVKEDERLHAMPYHALPFRRGPEWWRFISPERRDPAVLEAVQLVRLQVLTKWETEILREPQRALTPNPSQRTRYYYLSPAERRLLGIGGHAPDIDAVLWPPGGENDLDEPGRGGRAEPC